LALRSSESASCFLKAARSIVVAGLLMASSPFVFGWYKGDGNFDKERGVFSKIKTTADLAQTSSDKVE
jgi:hypothetical protein